MPVCEQRWRHDDLALRQTSGRGNSRQPLAAFGRRLGAASVPTKHLIVDRAPKRVALVARELAASGQAQRARGGQGQGGTVAALAHGVGNVQLQLQRQPVEQIVAWRRLSGGEVAYGFQQLAEVLDGD
eukprot:scaffold24073_cov62-Phaeocystis_antarctica.AAC.4